MRVFNKFPKETKCPICNTSKKGKGILIGKYGTREGNIMEAVPFHLDCIELIYYPGDKTKPGMIAQTFEPKEEPKVRTEHEGYCMDANIDNKGDGCICGLEYPKQEPKGCGNCGSYETVEGIRYYNDCTDCDKDFSKWTPQEKEE